MTSITECFEEEVSIAAAGRRLEGRLTYPAARRSAWCALMAGPHPLLAGDMHNNVVRSLCEGLAAGGAVSLRFNYSGVGKSEGGPDDWPSDISTFWKENHVDAEADWMEDARSASSELCAWCDLPQVVIGYSFGCQAAAGSDPGRAEALVLISPNPKEHDFDSLSRSDAPLLVVHSDNDFACGPDELCEWFDRLRSPKSRAMISSGQHFFRGREDEVLATVLEFLNGLPSLAGAPP